MTTKTNISLSGGKELEAILKQLPSEINQKAGAIGVRKAAFRVKNYVKQASPVDTGFFRARGWRIQKVRSRPNSQRVSYVVKLAKGFGFYKRLEFGDSVVSKPTHPFMDDAMGDAEAHAVSQLMIDETRAALKKAARQVFAKSKRIAKRRGY